MTKSNDSINPDNQPPYVTCECGKKILILHDARLMGEIIKDHAVEHIEKNQDIVDKAKEAARIEDLLTQQILDKIISSK